MYTPKPFELSDLKLVRQLITEHPLGLLIGPDAQGRSVVTHAPLLWDEGSEGWWLEGHMARANPHWNWLSAQRELLVVFNGPDAYVSPQHYEAQLNVPTWNYLAVHVYGELELVDTAEAKDALLKRLIARHEPAYAAQWRGLPSGYQEKLLGAIVGFRIHVRRCEAKAKLSQNRPASERERIRQAFEAGSGKQQELARWMGLLGL